MLLLFIFGVFISAIVATACGLIGYGFYTQSQELASRDDLPMPEEDETITEVIEKEIQTEIIEERV